MATISWPLAEFANVKYLILQFCDASTGYRKARLVSPPGYFDWNVSRESTNHGPAKLSWYAAAPTLSTWMNNSAGDKAFSLVTTALQSKYCSNFFHRPLDRRKNPNLISRLDVSEVFFSAFKVSVLLTPKLFSSLKQPPILLPRYNILFNILYSIW